MIVTHIRGSESCSGIPLKGWDSVRVALQAYSEGRVKGARATTDKLVEDVDRGSNGGVAAATLFVGALRGNPDAFVEQMLISAKEVIEQRGGWKQSYDYGALGTNFFKTSVGIKLIDKTEDVYLLDISAAYVGNEPEEGLAQFLGVSRALSRRMITITAEPLDEKHFTFDFSEIYEGIGLLFDLEPYVGTKIASHMMSGDKWGALPHFVLKDLGDLLVTVSLGRVEQRFVFEGSSDPRDTWTVEGPVLTGLLDRSYEDESKKEPPTFVISVSKKPEDGNSSRFPPVWDPQLRQKIWNLADQIGQNMFNGWP